MKYFRWLHKNYLANPTSDISSAAQTINITTRSTTNGRLGACRGVGSLSS
jgi:hypothetical protein